MKLENLHSYSNKDDILRSYLSENVYLLSPIKIWGGRDIKLYENDVSYFIDNTSCILFYNEKYFYANCSPDNCKFRWGTCSK